MEQENGKISDNSVFSTRSSDSPSKINLNTYNTDSQNNNDNKNKNKILKMKDNKEEEKEKEISGEEEIINKKELNSFIDNIEVFAKELQLIYDLKKDFYKNLLKIQLFCDYKENNDKEWQIGIIKEINDDNSLIIKDIKRRTKLKIKMDDFSKIAYFRKYSKISEENYFEKRDDKKELKLKLEYIENFINENNFVNDKDIFDLYYIIHSKIYLGLDSAMKINAFEDNEGPEESFRMILNILLFISQYLKYLLDNKDEFIYYENNKNNINSSDLIDLKVVNKKYAFFSFFEESIMLLNKIFANDPNYLDWFKYFENKLQKFVPSVEDKSIKPNTEYYPIYEDQTNKYENKNKLLLKKICLKNAYNLNFTYTSYKIKIKAAFLAYFIDYFYALNGFQYLFQLCYCHKSINIKLLLKILNGLFSAKTLTNTYKDLYLTEKQQLIHFVYIFIEQLNENTIVNYDKKEIIYLIQKTSKLVAIDKEEEPKLIENMYFTYIAKNLLLSKKLEQKISSLNILNEILYYIENKNIPKKSSPQLSDIQFYKMNSQDFCVNCKKNQILKTLLNDNSVHEEIIKRLPNIIYVMYENNFGYINKGDETKIESDKKMIFEVLLNKLLESEQNNENNSKNINNIILDFCEFLSEEDKLYLYNEIKKYFEKGIEKRGMPIKEQLLFIIEYSVRAISSKIENDKKNVNKNSEKLQKEEENEEDEEEEEEDEIIENEDDFSKEDDKLFNFKTEDKDYYGLNLLKSYLQEEEYKRFKMTNEQIIELINTSTEGIIKIIINCKNKDKDLLLKDIFFKAISALEKSTGIAQILNLIDKLRKSNKINKRFNFILEDYSKDYGLLTLLMNDMTRYLCLIDSFKEKKAKLLDINKIEESEEGEKYEGLFDNKLNIELRLKLILFILESENEDNDLKNFKKLILDCKKYPFIFKCLNKFIYLNLNRFEPIFIIFLYDNFLDINNLYDINDFQYYKLCQAIVQKINQMNNKFYFMNNKDIAVINCESESQIKGINVLWEFLIKTNSDKIINNITDFLADIFCGIKFDSKEKMNIYWKNFVKTIYDKLDEISKEKNARNEIAIKGIISLIKKIEKKSCNKGEVIEDISQVLNEIKIIKHNKNNKKNKNKDKKAIYKKCIFIGNLGNSNKILNCDIQIGNTEYFYMLRYKLSNYFKIPVNNISVFLDIEKYNKDMSEELKNLKFDLFNDFDNTFLLFNNIEKKINDSKSKNSNKNEENQENNLSLIFKVKSIENEKLKNIKNIIKNIPQLINLLKRKNSEYILDIWLLIKDENETNNNFSLIQNIKEILLKDDSENINSIFNIEDTNIFYISYILSNLIEVLKDLNEKEKNFISEKFLSNKIWEEKITNIKIEKNIGKHLEEIYEKNNIIKYLLDIYKLISLNTVDEKVFLFILNKLIEYLYLIIYESNNIDLKFLSSSGVKKQNLIEDLYIENLVSIQKTLCENKTIYENFINHLLSGGGGSEENNEIKKQFEFLFFEGVLNNKITSLNEKIKLFISKIIDNKFLNDMKVKEELFLYLSNFFNKQKLLDLIDYIKEISNNTNSIDLEIYEINLELYFEIIVGIIEKSYPIINNKFDFKSYISKFLMPRLFKPMIEDINLDSSFHEIIFGGLCKILVTLLSNSSNYKEVLNLKEIVEKKLRQFLFNEIIMNKCNKNIYNENNIDNYKSISITRSFSFKEAVNLFVFLLLKYMENNEKNEEEINFYLDKITELHNQKFWKNESVSDWKLSFNEDKKISPFVGLKNLGCTCYMNSLLQVFFNFIPFRESLLKCECKEEPKNSLYQIKTLFYSLKYLKINYYSPDEFPENFDDEILNVHQQMDVDEFYIKILDKIENRLKGTKNENLVKYFFQGTQNDILTFQDGCTHHRTNSYNFYSIQLQVQNKKNIYESLDTFTEGELMNGDNCIFCPNCDKKVPVLKTQNFKSLPRILLFVLKRFEFNYNSKKKVKINDYYEFPLELDMAKYINDSSSSENNIYVLKSIVIHMGTCENGHYYAYIKNNNGNWYEFNDTQVHLFDIDLLNEEAFGGDEIIYSEGEEIIRKKNRSAYLLFYEKKDQSNCEQFENIDAINSFLGNEKKEIINSINNPNINNNNKENGILNNINAIENGGLNLIEREENKVEETGIKNILENINEEMFKYFLNRKLFSNEYQYFILELFLNILDYYYNSEIYVFLMHLCRNLNSRSTEIYREIQASGSNLNLYLDNKKLILFNSNKPKIKTVLNKNYSSQILNIFKHFIIYFYNIFLKTKEKKYFGCMVDLLKFLLNDQLECADYLIEEFCNESTIVEYLINCPLYDIKKLIVGILYCAMGKSFKENEFSKVKKEKKINQNIAEKEEYQNIQKSSNEDEELARMLQNEERKGYSYDYEKNNPLEYEKIPKNILKMIYNILHIIRDSKYNQMNEHRFLYFTIYKFSLISQKCREFLIYKCRVFELLCLILHNDHQLNDYIVKDIVLSTYIGPYTVSHNILNQQESDVLTIIKDKGGIYRNENYVYMLFFYLLSYTPSKEIPSDNIVYDSGYSLENKNFLNVLLNNIRTKQDAFGFSNYINEKSKNSKSKINNVYDVLGDRFLTIDNNDKINYEYNNYKNFVNNNMNENPNKDDPGINPKYLIMILKKFILSQLPKQDYVKKGIKLIFYLFSKNQGYYSYSMMLIDLIIELFTNDLKEYSENFLDDLDNILKWLENWPIPPIKYNIEGISMYKKMKINYDSNLSEETKNEFNNIELVKTQKKIDKIYDILSDNIKDNNENNYKKDLDLSDFKFIIGDTILYQNKERVVEEALDEQLKISVDIDMKNANKNTINNYNKKEIWIEIDDPTIEIKELKGK